MVRNSPTPTMRSMAGSPDQRQRPRIAAMETGPGPACYVLPGTCGKDGHDPSRRQNPCFSFGARTKQFSSMSVTSQSPGPVYYISSSVTRTGKDGTSAFSLLGRAKDLSRSQSPGPAAYNTDKIHPYREPHAPAYSFGKRLDSTHSRCPTPSPNAYTLPTLVGSAIVGKKSYPAYSIQGRAKLGGFDEDLRKTPAPGTYRVVDPQVYCLKSPSFTQKGRVFPPGNNTRIPGPGAHNPEKVTINRKAAPSFSFGVKHSEYIASYLDKVV